MKKAFDGLNYDEFKKLALDESLSSYEKIGFPNSYRKGFENLIFNDLNFKLKKLTSEKINILDIGPGCSDLALKIIKNSIDKKQNLHLIDSKEMLDLLPDSHHIKKIEGFFPDTILKNSLKIKFDVVICYSVFHYIFAESSIKKFVKLSSEILKIGGQMLIGDIPNISKRNRFFSTKEGIRFHQKFMKSNDLPKMIVPKKNENYIDDDVLKKLVFEFNAQNCDASILTQPKSLPMYNRREDLLITKY